MHYFTTGVVISARPSGRMHLSSPPSNLARYSRVFLDFQILLFNVHFFVLVAIVPVPLHSRSYPMIALCILPRLESNSSAPSRIDIYQHWHFLSLQPEGAPQEYQKSVIIDFTEGRGSLTETVNITLPPDLVEGSQYIKVTAIGKYSKTLFLLIHYSSSALAFSSI